MNRRLLPILLLRGGRRSRCRHQHPNQGRCDLQLRIASLAPAGSSSMKILNAWNKTLQEKTDGKVKMRFYPGGSQGDERDFVRKMRVGQLDGGVVTMTGMSMLVPAMNVLTLPGFLDTYEELDRVRDKMASEFEGMFGKEGMNSSAGVTPARHGSFPCSRSSARPTSNPCAPGSGKTTRSSSSSTKSSARARYASASPKFTRRFRRGWSTSSLPRRSPRSRLQWYTRVKYMTAHNSAIIAGGTVMRQDKYDELPPSSRGVRQHRRARARASQQVIRKDDEKPTRSSEERASKRWKPEMPKLSGTPRIRRFATTSLDGCSRKA